MQAALPRRLRLARRAVDRDAARGTEDCRASAIWRIVVSRVAAASTARPARNCAGARASGRARAAVRQVLGSRVALVAVEAVVRPAQVQLEQRGIARGLGEDRCGRDRRVERIAAHQRLHRALERAARDCRRPGERGRRIERGDRAAHREHRRLQDVQPVDLGDARRSRPTTPSARSRICGASASRRAALELLRVPQAGDRRAPDRGSPRPRTPGRQAVPARPRRRRRRDSSPGRCSRRLQASRRRPPRSPLADQLHRPRFMRRASPAAPRPRLRGAVAPQFVVHRARSARRAGRARGASSSWRRAAPHPSPRAVASSWMNSGTSDSSARMFGSPIHGR